MMMNPCLAAPELYSVQEDLKADLDTQMGLRSVIYVGCGALQDSVGCIYQYI